MRRLSVSIARGVLALSVVCVLAMPAEARSFDDPWFGRDRIVKVIKKIVRSLGDGLGDPRP